MDWFKIIKNYYDYIKVDGTRMYSKEQVARFVELGKITATQYKEITGEDLPEVKPIKN